MWFQRGHHQLNLSPFSAHAVEDIRSAIVLGLFERALMSAFIDLSSKPDCEQKSDLVQLVGALQEGTF